MPIDKTKYPADWEAISRRIRFERAKGKCEQCGAEHGSWVWRSYTDPLNYLTLRADGDYYTKAGERVRMSEMDDEYLPRTDREYDTGHDIKVVLTVAHLDHDTTNNDESNLKALCQKCHLRHDAKEHGKHAAQTRRNKRDQATGQMRLIDDAS